MKCCTLYTTISLENYSQENNGYVSESGYRYCDQFHDSGRRFCHTSLHKIYLITSDYHMRRTKAIATIVLGRRRARAIASIVLGSRGIAVTPLAVSSRARQVKILQCKWCDRSAKCCWGYALQWKS